MTSLYQQPTGKIYCQQFTQKTKNGRDVLKMKVEKDKNNARLAMEKQEFKSDKVYSKF